MKKLLAIVVLGLIWTNNSFSDEISGKWISNYSGSLFEIIPKDKKSYEVYMLYSGRHFREYKSGTKLIAKFEKKTTGYSGTFKVLDNESLDEFFANAKFKIKDNEIKINVKGKNPNSNKKFKFTVNYVRYNETDPLPTGEVLFGLKIGNNYKNYKYLREFKIRKDQEIGTGDELKASYFKEGQFIDVSGYTKGKGLAGVMKRHNFAGLRASHGVSV